MENLKSNITDYDRLRYLEAMLCDEVKMLHRASQDSLNRQELDAQHSVMKLTDFYDKVVHVFNDPNFKPETKALPDLHPKFAESIVL